MKFFILIMLLICNPCLSQKKDTTIRFLNEDLNLTTEKEAVYVGVSLRENNHWLLFAIYADTTPVLKAYYKDKQLKVRDSLFIVYYPKHIRAIQQYYTNNKVNGPMEEWYQNGQPKDSGDIFNNQMVGSWKSWFENGKLRSESNYKQKINSAILIVAEKMETIYEGSKEGFFTTWYANGNPESSGRFNNDLMEGEWKWFYLNGLPSTIEKYEMGKLASISCYDSTGIESLNSCAVSRPARLKQNEDYRQYIQNNLIWPDEAIRKKIEGVVKVHFKINKYGVLEILNLEGEYEILKNAVAELFLQMKDWYPAVSHNRPVDWETEITIPFYHGSN